jgi:hypothetical protein
MLCDDENTGEDETREKRSLDAQVYVCGHCSRGCWFLVYEVGCTLECALSFWLRYNSVVFDHVYASIQRMQRYTSYDVMPEMLPRREENESFYGFWQRMEESLYDPNDCRYEWLREQYRENMVVGEVGDLESVFKQQRSHRHQVVHTQVEPLSQ